MAMVLGGVEPHHQGRIGHRLSVSVAVISWTSRGYRQVRPYLWLQREGVYYLNSRVSREFILEQRSHICKELYNSYQYLK